MLGTFDKFTGSEYKKQTDPITREQIMETFRDASGSEHSWNELLTVSDCQEIFCHTLRGNTDVTKEIFDIVLGGYGCNDDEHLEVIDRITQPYNTGFLLLLTPIHSDFENNPLQYSFPDLPALIRYIRAEQFLQGVWFFDNEKDKPRLVVEEGGLSGFVEARVLCGKKKPVMRWVKAYKLSIVPLCVPKGASFHDGDVPYADAKYKSPFHGQPQTLCKP